MIPVWVYFVVAGIIVSAFMAVKTGRDERKVENDMIEQEGEVYMKRLEEARDDKKSEHERSLGV
ncbi:sporulation YhaL family protein [Bacillus sp. CRN 9]|uniref:sporulation YhaL family protein n=1 Tax=Cytobacillus horneckiae TaxID=549687 RepID=UPI001562A206|nr:SigE-dependent sporulation protein [Bacillus sp. CRN 9]